jgi:hypothetical protein
MVCTPNNISLPPSILPSPLIPGFGSPFAVNIPNISVIPIPGLPEDLLALLNSLNFQIPPGLLQPNLGPWVKDVFGAIMKVLDLFLPFLMLYKFLLPLLNMIICIINVLCSLLSPFSLPGSLITLFTQCLPQFLNLFPIFALIIMIISILLLIIALIAYVILRVLALIAMLLRNILALQNAFAESNANGVLAIAAKIGSILCIFQNLFVLFAIFEVILNIVESILQTAFGIPPCGGGGNSQCCNSNVCPAIISDGPYTLKTGTLQYLNEVDAKTTIPLPVQFGTSFNVPLRQESWQLYDLAQPQQDAFSNIYDGYDVTADSTTYDAPYYKPVFFPTSSSYSGTTPSNQAAYTIDLEMDYDPSQWGRTGPARRIRFLNCIVLSATSPTLTIFDNSTQNIATGVLSLAGGKGYEMSGNPIPGYDVDGVTPITAQATLGNFIHKPAIVSSSPSFSPTDGYTFTNITYTFKPNTEVLMSSGIITLGCMPEVALARTFVNTAYASNVGTKTAALKNIKMPKPGDAQKCLSTALTSLRSNLTVEGVSEFQAMTSVCLQQLQNDTNNALTSTIGIGVEPCSSSVTLYPEEQFTSVPIKVQVSLNETNGLLLTNGIPEVVSNALSPRIKAYATFGHVSPFTYDGYQYFTAELTSGDPGKGQLMISFDDNIFCTNTTSPMAHTLQQYNYQFVYAPSVLSGGEGSTGTGANRRTSEDIADAGNDN